MGLLKRSGQCISSISVTCSRCCLHLQSRLGLQVYCLLSRMAAMVPLLGGRRPLFLPTATRVGTTVEFQGDNTVLKQIKDFKAFAEENCTSFQEVHEAYAAAAEAASEAARQQRSPWLVSASDGPKVFRSGTYQVQAGPLGYTAQPNNEQVGD